MNTVIQIITLQNAIFNQWAWIVGTVIILIITGMNWDNFKRDEPEPMLMVFVAFWWPICLLMTLVWGIVYFPIWIGRQLSK